jgi:hypothetical protein
MEKNPRVNYKQHIYKTKAQIKEKPVTLKGKSSPVMMKPVMAAIIPYTHV